MNHTANHAGHRHHHARTRRCQARRFPHLPAANRAAGPGQKPVLCWTCGGFHLTPATPLGDLR